MSIVSYKQLNKGKYEVISEMEDELPAEPFDREWVVLDHLILASEWRDEMTYLRPGRIPSDEYNARISHSGVSDSP
ncbi:MAG: hypothetical protein V5A28_00795 [Haloarculaceae archaeon]